MLRGSERIHAGDHSAEIVVEKGARQGVVSVRARAFLLVDSDADESSHARFKDTTSSLGNLSVEHHNAEL